jgi:hypothetical protein
MSSKDKAKAHSPSAAHSLTWTHPGENMLHMISEQSEKPILFDVAWEVCRFDVIFSFDPVLYLLAGYYFHLLRSKFYLLIFVARFVRMFSQGDKKYSLLCIGWKSLLFHEVRGPEVVVLMFLIRKVGGIYTVLTTKALVTVQEWHDR